MVTTTENVSDNIGVSDGLSESSVNPAVVLDKSSGPVGTKVTMTGTGFTALTAVAITFGDVAITPDTGAVVSDALGDWVAVVTIPQSSIGAKSFTSYDGISNRITNTFTVNGLNIMSCPVYTDFKNNLKSYKAGTFTTEVNDDSDDDVVLIDMRGSSELDIQLKNTGPTNGLTYHVYGMYEELNTPVAYDSTRYDAVSGGTANIAAGATALLQITVQYSWVLVRAKRQTSGQDTVLVVNARHKQ